MRNRVKILSKYLKRQKFFGRVKFKYNVDCEPSVPNTFSTKRVIIEDFICSPVRGFNLFINDKWVSDGLTEQEFKELIKIMED